MTEFDLSIVIPVFNEQSKIRLDIQQASDFLIACGLRGEILVVDDGSTDQSVEVAKHTPVPKTIECRVITLDVNRGKGFTVRSGMTQTRGRYAMFVDSGSCIPYAQIKTGLDLLQKTGCALAMGSRRHPESHIVNAQTLKRRIHSRLFRAVITTAFPSLKPFADTQCGFKLFDGPIARDLFSETQLNGFLFDIEAILWCLGHGHTVCDFPVHWTCDRDTRLHPHQELWSILKEIHLLRKLYR